MDKIKILFEITKNKTEVTAIGSKGIMKVNITDSEAEKDFKILLHKINELEAGNEVKESTNLDNWNQIV